MRETPVAEPIPDSSIEGETLVLDLLAAGASLERLHARVERLRAAPGADDARVDRLLAAAVDLHRAIEEDRRHSRGMAAIDDTAVDLASLRDVDEVLQAICRRARTLLGTNASYITLRDPERDDTYVRTTDGIVTEPFRVMRLPSGIGLGGLVAAQGIPAETSDYVADERFAHTAQVDRCVAGEGLRAIVGVPLRRGEEILGVLMSGSRSPRRFDPSEVALFQALATHAAIAIENARLFEEARRSYLELEAANEAIRRRNEQIEAAALLHERLATLVVEGAGLAEVLEAMAEAVGGTLELTDGEGASLASACAGGPESSRRVDVPVAAGAEVLARLRWHAGAAGDVAAGAELLQRGAVILAGQLLARRARSEADFRLRSELVDDLFDERRFEPEAVARKAARVGFSLTAPHVVLVAEIPPAVERWAALRAARAAAAESGLAWTIDRRVVAVVPAGDPQAAAERWMPLLTAADGSKPTIGVSRPATGLEALREAHAEARNVLGLLGALERGGTAACVEDLGVFGVVFGKARPAELRGFLDRMLGPVLAYDAGRGDGGLLATLSAYFANHGHLNNTARELGIHVNTLYLRLERLEKLLGDDWRTPDRQLQLHLALRLRALTRRLPSSR